MKNWLIDRIEGEYAVVEYDGNTFDVPLRALPLSVKEGDMLDVIINKEETKNRKDCAEGLLKDLFGDK